MKFSFNLKLFLYSIIIILFTSIPIGFITYNHIYDSLRENTFSSTENEMMEIDNGISNLFRDIKENNNFLASTSTIKMADSSILALFNMPTNSTPKKFSKTQGGIETAIYEELKAYSQTHPDAAYAYMGTKWGGYIQSPDGLAVTDYDPRTRPWYTQAINNPGEVMVSDPYISSDESHSIIISTSTSIKNNEGTIVGVVGLDVSLKKLSEIVSKSKVGEKGYLFLFTKDGTMLAHPNNAFLFKNITALSTIGVKEEKSDKIVKYAIKDYNKILKEHNAAFETYIDGEAVLVNVYTSPFTGWKMASVIQESELIAKATRIGYAILFIALLIIVIAIFLTSIVTKKITRPLREMTTLMQGAGGGDLSVRATISSKDEFGELANCFNVMIEKLHENREELTSVHEELVATEEELRAQYETLLYNEEALRNSEERYKLALDGANDAIWEWDLQTDDFFTSSKWNSMIGIPIDRKLTFNILLKDLIHPDDIVKAKKDFMDHINLATPFYNSEFRLKIKADSYLWVHARGTALRDLCGKAIKIAGSITDISTRKKTEEKINFMAFYDSLTNLPNRTLFMHELNKTLEKAALKKSTGAVLFIDLDNFKIINDTMGHEYGDKLLKYLASELENVKKNLDTICRFGGDEFILLHPFTTEEDAIPYAKTILKIFNKLFEIEGKQMYITASVGIALYPKDGVDANSILKSADTAMYKAKESGKNRYTLYDSGMYFQLERKAHIEMVLRNAIGNNELHLHYQPQYDLEKEVFSGFEALLRLHSAELGVISPIEFIPIAEETGYIVEIGRWVLREACAQSERWREMGYRNRTMSVNVSSIQIHQPDFIEVIKEILVETGISPKNLELEITETVLMQSLDSNVKTLKKLMDMGIKIALDDFGTGYSSLNYLRKIPISTLKIDKSFIDHITCSRKEETLIQSIIQMAHGMELNVIAEGVETEDQLSLLKGKHCDHVQGYFFSKPLPAHEIESLMKQYEKNTIDIKKGGTFEWL